MKTKTPSELAQFSSLGDFPVPTRIQNVFGAGPRSRSRDKAAAAAKRRYVRTVCG